MKKYKLSVQDFSVPAPKLGSLESSGPSLSFNRGIELHQIVQKKNKQNFPNYTAEVKLTHEFQREKYLFAVDGRLDGIFDGDVPIIEEIKTSGDIQGLKIKLESGQMDHPYIIQLMTYGYFYFKKHNIAPILRFLLISTKGKGRITIDLPWNESTYECWLDLRLKELVNEVHRYEKNNLRRKKLASSLTFPFDEPRRGQMELVETIEKSFAEKKSLMIQAPTGLGKTMGVLYPSLKEALGRGEKVIYVTPKNSQQEVAEDAVEKIHQRGSKVRSLTLTAKTKICMKEEMVCDPSLCEYASEFHTKVHEKNIKEVIFKKKKLTSKVFRLLALEHVVCPFELQLMAVESADVVICDYNHVFANRSALDKVNSIKWEDSGLPNLLIDEAHNLPHRSMSFYSPSLSAEIVEKMQMEARVHTLLEKEWQQLTKNLLDLLGTSGKGLVSNSLIKPDIEEFVEMGEAIKHFLIKHLESGESENSKDPVLSLFFYWTEFCDILEYIKDGHDEFFASYYPREKKIKITCCDPSAMLRPKYELFQNVIAFSATLKPFDFYRKLCGFESEKVQCAEFESPFEVQNRKLMIIPQISTKYSERERSYPRIAETIRRVIDIKKGNYIALFPSFEFMEKTLSHLGLENYTLLKQKRSMNRHETENFLTQLRNGEPTLLMAVQGGVFSEGVDYPGSMLIGAFIVGPPLASFDFERERIKDYYQQEYQKGSEYAYTYPAMAKSVQSAGRVIRSETDQGLIILMDDRFLESSYSHSMPTDWFSQTPSELVSQSILKDVENFWNSFS